MWIIITWQHISPEVSEKGFKTCCISTAMDGLMIFCGMAVKRKEQLGAGVRKMKPLTVKMGDSDTDW
jgi:hypothetical protein